MRDNAEIAEHAECLEYYDSAIFAISALIVVVQQ